MKHKGFSLIEVVIATVFILIILVGFGTNVVGFSGVVDGASGGLIKADQYNRDMMLAQELLSQKITAVKQEYHKPAFAGISSIPGYDSEVLKERRVAFKPLDPTKGNVLKFNIEYRDKTAGNAIKNISNLNLRLDDVLINYKTLAVTSKGKSGSHGNDATLYYTVGDSRPVEFEVPAVESLELAVNDSAVRANATNTFLPVKMPVNNILYNNSPKRVIAGQNLRLDLKPKWETKAAGLDDNFKSANYVFYRTFDPSYNVAVDNYDTNAGPYSSLADDELNQYTALFPPSNGEASPSAKYLEVDSKLSATKGAISYSDNSIGKLAEEFFGYQLAVLLEPISKQYAQTAKVFSPSVYIAPRYLVNPQLKYAINGSWIDVREQGSSKEIRNYGGNRLINFLKNYSYNSTSFAYSGNATLKQANKNELYVRCRYINLKNTSNLSFPLDNRKKYTIFVVGRNNVADATTGNDQPILADIRGTVASAITSDSSVYTEGSDYYLPLKVGKNMPFKGSTTINTWYYEISGKKYYYFDDSQFTKDSSNLYKPSFISDSNNPKLTEINSKLGEQTFYDLNGVLSRNQIAFKNSTYYAKQNSNDNKANIFRVNIEPQTTVPNDQSHFWKLEEQVFSGKSEYTFSNQDIDLAELLIFEGELSPDYKRALMDALRQKYAPLNEQLNIVNYNNSITERYKQGDLYSMPAAITGAELFSGKKAMATIEFDDPLDAASKLNTINKGTITVNAHLKDNREQKLTYTLIVD